MKNLLIILAIIIPSCLVSQDFDKYYKEKQKEFDKYLSKTEEEYKKFVEERDKEFSKHLKETWDAYQVRHAKSFDSKPKPDRYPVYVDSVKQDFEILEFNKPTNDTISYKPQIRKIRTVESFAFYKKKLVSFNFYNEEISIEYEDLENFNFHNAFDNKKIANYWDALNNLDFDNCLSQLVHYKTSLNLNDWGYYLFIREFSKQISEQPEFYKLVLWYLMLKSEYNVKIGYTDYELLVLVPFSTDIYGIPYYEINNEIFYVFESQRPETIRTYIKYYPGASHIVEPCIKTSPNLDSITEHKNIEYTYMGQLYPLYIDINSGLIDFYNNYPLMELENYFNSVMSDFTKASLFKSFEKILADKNEEEAVSFLLYFSQNAFKYKTDLEHFGREKAFFPDEMFLYNYSDCEDRAVFFAYIVKELLSLKVIGLDYNDHVAVAINFNEEVDGNFINWKGEKYVICDPTYINAPIGRIPPKQLNKKATLINIEF